jgi:hypothetical protein
VKPTVAAFVAALMVVSEIAPAARAHAQAAGPFTEVPLRTESGRTHALAYASLLAGAGLIGGSFALSHRADDTYDDYLAATDPPRIEKLYDRTVRYDHLSSASLLTGELLIATGLYLRFLRRSSEPRLSLELGARRCAATLRF